MTCISKTWMRVSSFSIRVSTSFSFLCMMFSDVWDVFGGLGEIRSRTCSPLHGGTSAVGSLRPESLASDSNRDCAGLESAASAGWTSEGLDYREFSACFVLPVLRIYSSCVTIDISAERRYPMNPKDSLTIDLKVIRLARQSFCLTRWFSVWKRLQKMRTTENIWI